jgi:ribosomal protein S6--L-glutamate ligase
LPATGFAHAASDYEALIARVGGTPVIIKLLEGTQGIGVMLAETQEAARSVLETLQGLDARVLVQEFIHEAKRQDIRCIVVGKKVIAAMQRTAAPGEFRANMHRGGTAAAVTLTPEEAAMACKATRVLGLQIAGVDLLRTDKGSMVLEVNASPGLQAVEQATGVDIAGAIIAFVTQRAAFAARQAD